MIAEAQRRGGICAFIDAEHAMDPTYARRIGVNIDDLLVSQPDTGEQALEIAELLIRSGALDVVAVDSVAALTPKAEIEGEMGDSHVGLQARLMSQALRKLAGTLNRTDTICLFTNQLREKIGVMFGSPETTPGGRALKFYASVRLDIRRIETLKDGAEAFGNRVRVKVVKNKVAPPFKQAEFDIIYGSGISWEGSVLDVALERKIVPKSGSYFSFGDERLGQGRQNATAFLAENPDLVQAILPRIQAEAPAEQVVSARLLPQAAARARRGRGRSVEVEDAEVTAASRHPSVVTALRRRGGRVAVELDGASWRTCRSRRRTGPVWPSGSSSTARAAAAARSDVGRLEALSAALGALRHRDHSALVARPAARAARRRAGRPPAGAQTLTRAGVVDDARFAHARAAGSPPAARATCSADDLERQGVAPSSSARRSPRSTRAGARAGARRAPRRDREDVAVPGREGLHRGDDRGRSLQIGTTAR